MAYGEASSWRLRPKGAEVPKSEGSIGHVVQAKHLFLQPSVGPAPHALRSTGHESAETKIATTQPNDLPPSEWSIDYFSVDPEGEEKWASVRRQRL